MDVISGRQNPRFKALLRNRKDKGLIFLEGRRLVEDALARGFTPVCGAVSSGYLEQYGRPPFEGCILENRLFNILTDTETPQGIMVMIETPWADLDEARSCERIVVLDGLQDPGNVGTIIRTAEAFGFDMVIVTPGTAAPFSEKAVRASMGSCLGIKICRATPEELGDLPHRRTVLSLEGSRSLQDADLNLPLALCFGQEGAGVSAELLASAHQRVLIPMPGRTESLNVAVAAGIVMAKVAGSCG